MATHVLIPVDDSDRSTAALEFALEEYPSARLTALHVLDPGDIYTATGIETGRLSNYERIREEHENRAENLLETVRRRASEAGVDLETDSVTGDVSETIVDYAENNAVDHVVIGSHGRTGASRILLGSVAETVARRSPVPVTIVR
ncbi:universal stress protein [Natronococcus occultus]|uniref:Universal stress protein UspA-like protein n=1 Tax=Natronococcus occultus SP4 TaxID=694430 RepID=L0K121_9EURY|nr:universal stress protein [Natronococcus occultus]AGB38696.1 universal stress protein UspA-like protein [Natronococcus occultus SP4]